MDSIARLPSDLWSWLLESELATHVEVYVDYLKPGQYANTTIKTYVALTMKEHTLAELQKPDCKVRRDRAPDTLLEFLQTL